MKKTAKTIISLLLLFCTVFTVMPSELAVNTSAAGGRLYGDINADGEISAADYVALRRHILKSKILDDGDMKYADEPRRNNKLRRLHRNTSAYPENQAHRTA